MERKKFWDYFLSKIDCYSRLNVLTYKIYIKKNPDTSGSFSKKKSFKIYHYWANITVCPRSLRLYITARYIEMDKPSWTCCSYTISPWLPWCLCVSSEVNIYHLLLLLPNLRNLREIIENGIIVTNKNSYWKKSICRGWKYSFVVADLFYEKNASIYIRT